MADQVALRTDTPEEQRVHYPLVSARRSAPWDDRAAWTANRHQVNSITVAEVRDSVSTAAATYATADQIAAAGAELNAAWTRAGRAVRDANKAAQAVFPMRYTRATHAAYCDALWALTDEQRTVVERARDLRDARHELRKAATSLGRFGTVERRDIRGFGALLSDSCPTFTAIVQRIVEAGEKAAAEYVARIQSLPVDDEAWARELASREELEAWFRRGPVVRHLADASERIEA